MVFHCGTLLGAESIVSTTRRIDGSGGKIYSFWAMIFLQDVVLDGAAQLVGRHALLSATAMYMAQNTAAGELIVIEVETLSSGMPFEQDLHIGQ